jgi:hypothetical protein
MVGIPAENAFREPEPGETATPPNNAELGYINEFGDPASRIPPRPFLIPTINEMQPEIVKRLHKVADIAISGSHDAPEKTTKGFMALGMRCASAVQLKITNGPFKPLAEYTIWKRQHRKPPRMGTKPLMDLGHMRRAVTFAIRKIKGKSSNG